MIKQIIDVAGKIKQKWAGYDVFDIIKGLGILLLFEPMGSFENACKGFFLLQSRQKSITVNSELDVNLQRLIAAHELGHALLHSGKSFALSDFNMFSNVERFEFEANIFAAELLLSDSDVLDKIADSTSFFMLAKDLNVCPELLDYKIRCLNKKGAALLPPLYANAKFLKKISTVSNSTQNY